MAFLDASFEHSLQFFATFFLPYTHISPTYRHGLASEISSLLKRASKCHVKVPYQQCFKNRIRRTFYASDRILKYFELFFRNFRVLMLSYSTVKGVLKIIEGFCVFWPVFCTWDSLALPPLVETLLSELLSQTQRSPQQNDWEVRDQVASL